MMRRILTMPEIGLIAGTRAALGAGIGLLLADRLNDDQRRAIGWTLVAVGVLSTVPLAANVMLGHQPSSAADQDLESSVQSPRKEEELFASHA